MHDNFYPDHNITRNDIKEKCKVLVKMKKCAWSIIILLLSIIVIIIIMSIWIGIYVPLKQKYDLNSHCLHAPSSIEILIAQNSTVILLNTTEYYASDLQTCYEPNITIETEYLVNVSLIPCQNLQYSEHIQVNRTSLEYTNVKNPLPVAFDESCCHSPNYLVNGHINVGVKINVSVSKLNPRTPEYIYFCLYTAFDQFQSIRSKSTESYWKTYSGTQCNARQLGGDDEIMILKSMFNITRSEYIFVDFGSTVDPLNSFQFNISVSGQTLLYPRQSSFVKQSCNLSDGQDTCQLSLNLLARPHASEAMCIVGYRRRDRSGIPFGKLTIKLIPIKPKDIKVIFGLMIAFVVLGLIVLSILCLVILFICCKISKLDRVAGPGPNCVQASDGESVQS